MIYPVRKVFITQEWGVNPDIYSRFGFKGHNGIDLRVYNNSGIKAQTGDLIAPHDGKIIEAVFDKDGYGWYYKIENSIEGSILAHNDALFLKVGDLVKEGQVIARTGNTGWSTAPHVHWGYYRFPRNKQNGYGGTINQLQFDIKVLGEQNMSLVTKYGASSEQDLDNKIMEHVGLDWGNANNLDNKSHLAGERRKSKDLEKKIFELKDEFINLKSDRDKLAENLSVCQSKPPTIIVKEVPVEIIVEKPIEVIKEVKVEVIKEVLVTPENLGALQLITLTLKAAISGRW